MSLAFLVLAATLGSAPRPAPAFALSASGGGSVTLAGLRGSPVLLVFYRGHWCGLCVEQLVHLASLRGTSLSGVTVLGISPDPPETGRDLALKLGKGGVTLLSDPAFETAAAYGARNRKGSAIIRPTWVLIDPQGRETWRYTESHTRTTPPDDELAAAVARVRPVGEPAP